MTKKKMEQQSTTSDTSIKEPESTPHSDPVPNVEPGIENLFSGNTESEPEQGKPVRKRRAGSGRKKKPEPEPEPIKIMDATICKMIAGIIPFTVLAYFTRDDSFKATKEETDFLGEYWEKVLNKRLPAWFENFQEEVALVSAIAIVIIQKKGSDIFPGINGSNVTE